MENLKKYSIKRYKGGKLYNTEDDIVVEHIFKIILDDEEFINLICTPKSLKSLAVGFLHSEGIINSINDILDISLCEKGGYVNIKLKNKELLKSKINQKRAITTGCGKGSIYYKALEELQYNNDSNKKELDYDNIMKLINNFNTKSELFKNTGGVHSVALSDFKNIIFFEEDIGRHNALDKIVGKCLLNNIDTKDKLILTSGRITSEIILKGVKLNINYIVSRSAATNMAIDLAKKLNLTIIGFARNDKMNIYNE